MTFLVFIVFAKGFVLKKASFFFETFAGLDFSGLIPFVTAYGRYFGLELCESVLDASCF